MSAPGPASGASRRDVVAALVEADLRRRFGRGPLRVLRWILEPFVAIGVYLLLVAYAVDRPGDAPGLSIACAVVPFQLVMTSVVSALRCVETRSAIVANIAFNRGLLPVAAVVTELIGFAGSLVLLGVMMAVYGIAPTPALLLLPVVVAVTFVLAVAAAFPVALLGTWMPELQPYVVAGTRALYFLAPGIVALNQVHGNARDLLQINPLTGLFEAFRDITLRGQVPAAWELLYPLAFALVLLAIVMPLWRSEERHFAKALQS